MVRLLHGTKETVNEHTRSCTQLNFPSPLSLSLTHPTRLVNYFGLIRCCKAFLPLFKEQAIQETHTGGRIINITSMAGLISNGVMGMSAYSASKHAANAFSHILRTELLSSYNIQVCTVNPSFHKTPLVDTMGDVLSNIWEKLDPKLKEEYGEGTVLIVV
jgi:NAD(P)-dependent dehydrogenase (short-subunit alcohol dehydrogenase family)